MANYPSVRIIVLTHNQKDKTLRCLSSLQNIDYKNYAILLIDNGSTDNTIESVKQEFSEINVVYSERNLGVAGGRNKGAEISQKLNPDYFLFLDNDTVVEKDFLINLVSISENSEDIAIVTPKIMSFGRPGIIYGAGGCDIKFWLGRTSHVGYNQRDTGQFDMNKECISSGGCMLVKSKVFFELGGFDSQYNPYGPEDLDFVLRAKEKKYKCMYVYNSVIYHDPEPGKTIYQSRYYQYAKRKLKLLKMFIEQHASWSERNVFLYLIFPLLYFKAILKNILHNLVKET